jgi:O-antigen ligase
MASIFITVYLLAMTLMALPFPFLAVLLRGVMVVSLLPALIYPKFGVRRKEMLWIALVGLYLAGTLISTAYAQDAGEGWLDFGRQSFICLASILLMFYLREPTARRVLLHVLLVFAVVDAAIIIYLYLSNFSLYASNILNFKYFKTVVREDENFQLNTISYTLLVSTVLTRSLWSRPSLPGFFLTIAFLFLTVLCGSATSICSFLFGCLTYYFLKRKKCRQWLTAVGTGGVLAGVYAARFIPFTTLNDITTGRISLWVAATVKFLERPITGWGAQAWKADLASFLPIADRLQSVDTLESGGFHSAYLGLLADKGLVTFIPAMAMMVFLIRAMVLVLQRKDLFDEQEKKLTAALSVVVFMMPVQFLAEQAGLFGVANAAGDFLTYLIASFVVALAAESDARAALEEVDEEANAGMKNEDIGDYPALQQSKTY